jgi:hypothetical protein
MIGACALLLLLLLLLSSAALPEMLASRLLPEQVAQEAQWKGALPGGLQRLATQPREAMDYANDQVGADNQSVHTDTCCCLVASWHAYTRGSRQQ